MKFYQGVHVGPAARYARAGGEQTMARTALFALLMLAGCQAHLGYYAESGQRSQRSGYGLRVSTDGGDRVAAGIVAGALIVEGLRYSMTGNTIVSGELDPERAVAVQDCSQPIDARAGNLMCR